MQSSFRGVCSYVQHRCNVDLRFTKVNFSLVVEWMWNCVRVLYQGVVTEHFYLFIRFLMFCLPLKLELWFSAGSLISLVSLPWNNSLMMLSRWLPSGAACQERFGHFGFKKMFTLQCTREKSFHFAANDTIDELFELYYFPLFRGHTVQWNTSSYAQTECINLCTPPLGGYIVEKINSWKSEAVRNGWFTL